ncbi:MAG: prolyl oligopeptidase family serine peptidase [Proteobacteria bacterium]|nr:prolyl oligopeptidase family serine peptidase [Pseudomonadota bacterium]
MKAKFIALLVVFTASFCNIHAQEPLTYQQPPKEILELVDVKRAPSVSSDSKTENMLLIYRDSYKSIVELSEKELRLAGLRINPKTNIGSRVTYYNGVEILKVATKKLNPIIGLPKNPRMANFIWSHDQTKMAFTHTTKEGVELWYMDLINFKAKKLTEARLNSNMRGAVQWFNDDKSLLVKMLPKDKGVLIDSDSTTPIGPTVSISDGAKAQNRTYQDLLKNPNDELNFEKLATSELYKVTLKGKQKRWKKAAMYSSISFSPDGKFVSVTKIQRPFSYIVPYYRFPKQTDIFTAKGKHVKQFDKSGLIEDIPKGFMSVKKGKRSIQWRNDKPSTVVWAQALDEGDAEKEVEYRDEVFQLSEPFNNNPEALFKTKDRFYTVYWGDEANAVFIEYWWNTRMMKTSLFNPADLNVKPIVLSERNYQNVYDDPGSFVMVKNEFHKDVLQVDNGVVYLLGDGYSDKGQFPFVDSLNLSNNVTKRLYQSTYTDKVEDIQSVIDIKKGTVLVRVESATDYPNYYIRNINNNTLDQITDFTNPFKALGNLHKEVIRYPREDGLELSATLYLPVGYDMNNKEKLPMILWAYPTEFKDKNSASQNTNNPNEFTYPYYGSMLYWVTQGYAILDDASFPIVGEGDEEPNDTFIKQLVANGKAAIDAVDNLGYIDRNKVAVAGHSYGAFMTANLLSHSDLFAAGIARSGAYNRTLTPFGFQAEERNYWEAPEIYYNMSPFMHANTMNQPLLLIHGDADNNSGTYPLQSERYFNALKGLGATARLVMLPKESHGYRAKESILHMLWEQHQWLDKYVKNKVTIQLSQ